MADTRRQYQDLFHLYWPIGVAVFVIVSALVLFVLLRFRSGEPALPRGRDENKPLEGAYALALVGIAAALLYFTLTTQADIQRDNRRAGSVRVHVTAARWNWRFDYPALGISQIGSDVRPATLVVPVDAEVRFELTSADVQHAFWIPQLRFKRDAFPKRVSAFVLTFRALGFHREQGECGEFCGLRHSNMSFNVNVLEPAAFRRWVSDRRAESRRT